MKYDVYFSPSAKVELEAINDYILGELGVVAHRKFIKKLSASLQQLSSFPKTYPESPSFKGLRKIVVTSYTIMFFSEKGDRVEISAVFDGRRDYKSLEI